MKKVPANCKPSMKIIAPISSRDMAKYIASLDCTKKEKKCIKVPETVCRKSASSVV